MCWCGDMNVAIGYKNGCIHIINIISAEILQTFQSDSGGITTMAYVERQDRYSVFVCVVVIMWCVCMHECVHLWQVHRACDVRIYVSIIL